ncbi:hypothetical protein EU803_16020 [Loktanella sp. IMCC34160]|uniref:hypothetical protein n=1 Tax=Loktanella sp. IMCC34160 TaxID=2510646 RepID=UPI00101C6F52|nr:hypothetical protein [Loktanella sp. IMCC34160]RYG89660.1 hypothetical protein EU803_16020 [Loktanella sp. IMCC34160]
MSKRKFDRRANMGSEMSYTVRSMIFLAALAFPTVASPQDALPIFLESFHVTLPDGVAPSENQPAPIDEIKQQLSIVDSQGQEKFGVADASVMRMSLLREIFVEAPEDVPQLSQSFTVVADLEDLSVTEMANARMVSSYWFNFEGSNRIVQPLFLIRRGETWWRYDDALELSVIFDLSVPSVQICKFVFKEAICIHRFMDSEVNWRDRLSLSTVDTELSEKGYEALSQMAYYQLPLAILQSVTPTEAYRPCCKALR